MEQSLPSTIAILTRTPAALNALLRDLPENWTHRNEGEKTMSAWDVVGHLIHAERINWIPRAKMILAHGDSRPFDAFDRWGHLQEHSSKSMPELLDEFARARSASLAELNAMSLRPEDFDRRGLHPALGAVTLAQLLATWAAHDLTHLHQISRILAYQYREAVGPWGAFLGVLKCAGHSD